MATHTLEVHQKAEPSSRSDQTRALLGDETNRFMITRSGTPPITMVFKVADGPKPIRALTLFAPDTKLDDLVREFEVRVGPTAEALTSLGSFTLDKKLGPQRFDVPETPAGFVELTFKSNHGGGRFCLGKFRVGDGADVVAAPPTFDTPPPPPVAVADAEREPKLTLSVRQKAASEYTGYPTEKLLGNGSWSSDAAAELPLTMIFAAPSPRVIRSFALVPPSASADCVADFELAVGEREDALRPVGTFRLDGEGIQFFEIDETAATLIQLAVKTNHGGKYTSLGRFHAFGVPAVEAAKLLGVTVLSGVGAEAWPDAGARRTFVRNEGDVFALGFSHDGLYLAAGGAGGTIYTWDPNTGAQVNDVRAHLRATVIGMAMYPLAPFAVHASEMGIRFHLCGGGGRVPAFQAVHAHTVLSLSFSRDGDHMVSGDAGGDMVVWDLWTGKEFRRFAQGTAVNGLCFHPDGDHFAAAFGDGSVRIYKMSSDELVREIGGAHEGGCGAVSYAPDGQMLATCGADRKIKLWGADGALRASLEGHDDVVHVVAFRPRGAPLLATASDDRTVRLWRPDGRMVRTIAHGGPARALAWSPDGAVLATGAANRVLVFDVPAEGA